MPQSYAPEFRKKIVRLYEEEGRTSTGGEGCHINSYKLFLRKYEILPWQIRSTGLWLGIIEKIAKKNKANAKNQTLCPMENDRNRMSPTESILWEPDRGNTGEQAFWTRVGSPGSCRYQRERRHGLNAGGTADFEFVPEYIFYILRVFCFCRRKG